MGSRENEGGSRGPGGREWRIGGEGRGQRLSSSMPVGGARGGPVGGNMNDWAQSMRSRVSNLKAKMERQGEMLENLEHNVRVGSSRSTATSAQGFKLPDVGLDMEPARWRERGVVVGGGALSLEDLMGSERAGDGSKKGTGGGGRRRGHREPTRKRL